MKDIKRTEDAGLKTQTTAEGGVASFEDMVEQTCDKLQQNNAVFRLRKIDELEERLSKIEAGLSSW
ncbi:hypothetical protein FACS1894190_05620 [Spirochaetia bacterium]|nr:hypothetical protein FACS1894190_05620 [Spirochaetia bacterium]